MQKKPVELQFPIGGQVERYAYQSQPPFTTPAALNVRPESISELRYRGGTRPGLVKAYAQTLGDAVDSSLRRINMLEYVSWNSSGVLHQLCAAANGKFYKDASGTLTEVTSLITLGLSFTQGVDLLQKLYIADHSGSGNALRVFDPSANTLTTLTATAGTAPTGCKAIAKFRGRLVVANQASDPHQWFMSRVGDPLDWDYSVEDDTSAAISGTLAEAFKMGEAITAIVPATDLCLFFGCTNSLWMMKGDPGYGGQIDNLSDRVGIIDHGAWCKTPEGVMVFMSHDGLYMSYAGCDDKARPQSLSRERIPDELLAIDTSTTLCILEYDTFSRGVHIYLSPKTGSTAASHWYFDWENKGFWKVEIPGVQQPQSIRAGRGVSSSQSCVYLGGIDGHIRKYSTAQANDDGTTFESYLDFGPFGEGHGFSTSCLEMITGTLATGSNAVTWTVRTGNSPQAAFAASAAETGTWSTANWNYRSHPRVRGSDFYIRLRSATAQWTMERVGIVMSNRGVMRG
jgi:hypothetical protein